MDANPDGFSIDTIDFPQNLDERGRQKVASILDKYKTQVLPAGTETQPAAGASAHSSEQLPHNPDIVSL